MSEIKEKIKQAIPKGVIVDDAVLEKIVGGIQTGMTREDLNGLLTGVGLKSDILDGLNLGIAKPRPGGGTR